MPEAHKGPTSPWFYSIAAGRADYITPEDIDPAANAGADPLELAREVLDAISGGMVEDVKLCAFVAYRRTSK